MKARAAVARGGFVAGACVACCAPPVVAAFGITAGAAVTLGIFVGLAATIAAILVGATWILTRTQRTRRRAPMAVSVPAPVRVSAPTRGPGR